MMYGANKVITCYIEQNDETYKRYVVYGVSWREKTAVSTTDKGLSMDNFVSVRIPIESVQEGFAPTKESLVLLGDCAEEIGIDTKVATLKRKYNGIIVKAIHYNTDGQCPHWKLEGV